MPRFADMFVSPDADPRREPPAQAGERETLVGFLAWQRQTLELKCTGLDTAQLAARPIPGVTLSLLGLVRHLTEVERRWFRVRLAGEEAPPHYQTDGDPDRPFDGAVASDAMVEDAWARWRAEVAAAERIVERAPTLDLTAQDQYRGELSLRFVLTHMIEEYARHNGHADLLRQLLDGAVGQ